MAQNNSIYRFVASNTDVSTQDKHKIDLFISNAKSLDTTETTNYASVQIFDYEDLTNEYFMSHQDKFSLTKAIVFKRFKNTSVIQPLNLSQFQNLEYIILESKNEIEDNPIQSILSDVIVPDHVKVVFKYILVN